MTHHDQSTLFDLSGRTALVTGSSQGLGLVFARGLGRAGATLVLNGRDEPKLEAAAQALRQEGLTVATAACDITQGAMVAQMAAQIDAEHGPVDILVNNAGIHRRAPLAEMTEAQWREVLDTNLTSAFLVTRHFVPQMLARKAGKIINICSLMSELGRASTGNYAAAKGGLKMLTRAMATEWAGHNIQVNGIGPGYFATELTNPCRESRVRSVDPWAHPGRSMGQARGVDRSGGLSRLACLGLRQRPDHLRGRRLARRDLRQSAILQAARQRLTTSASTEGRRGHVIAAARRGWTPGCRRMVSRPAARNQRTTLRRARAR